MNTGNIGYNLDTEQRQTNQKYNTENKKHEQHKTYKKPKGEPRHSRQRIITLYIE